jgi:hypothetical protein
MSLTIDDLERWVLFGADWRVVDLSDELVVVDLCACTGEPVERRHSDDPVLIGYVRGKTRGANRGINLSETERIPEITDNDQQP